MKTGRVLLIALSSCVFVSVALFAVVSVTSNKPWGVPDQRREEYETRLTEIRRAAELREMGESDIPKLVVDNSVFDFGYVDTGTEVSHSFLIKNEGQGELLLEPMSTTCKCTVSDIDKRLLKHGEETAITLRWHTGDVLRDDYEQSAVIKTNDAKNPMITLTVKGKAKALVSFVDEHIHLGRLIPDTTASGQAIIYSQVTDSLSIIDIETEARNFEYKLEDATEEMLAQYNAKSGVVIRFGFSPIPKMSDVAESFKVVAMTGDSTETQERTFSVSGNLVHRVSFYAPEIDMREGLDIGTIDTRESFSTNVVVRVRGEKQPQSIEVLGTSPSFLESQITPIASQQGAYKLTISIPEGAPDEIFNTNKTGYVWVGDPNDDTMRRWLRIRGATYTPTLER